jgi:hypothetical protein
MHKGLKTAMGSELLVDVVQMIAECLRLIPSARAISAEFLPRKQVRYALLLLGARGNGTLVPSYIPSDTAILSLDSDGITRTVSGGNAADEARYAAFPPSTTSRLAALEELDQIAFLAG